MTPTKTPQAWAAEKKIPVHVLAGIMRHKRWAEIGELVTEAEFDAAHDDHRQEPIR